MNRLRTTAFTLAAIAAAGVALAGGMYAATTLINPATLANDDLSATYLENSREITDFRLVDHSGEPFDNADLQGQWTLLFFGFTHCPDICPMTLAELSRVHAMLEDEGRGDNVRTVFVTVDPARDTPERLEAYVTNFRDDFRGVTGALDDIDVLARDMGIAHIRHDEEGGTDYAVDHGASVLLVNPDGRFQAMFGSPHRAPEIVEDLKTIVDFHGSS
ncbi:SCO family protein [Aquisalimonas sp.]|uniref:SCO family protein n=1 Tax=unclassified Aquisalimonas TaxID=2644645 RepID=UPI0025BEDA07|nr:SCO family protein [Aquisalimonas sp.]